MENTEFRLEVSYHGTTGDPVAGYLRIRKGKIVETKDVSDGIAFADFGEDGTLLGVELLGPCWLAALDQLAEKEREPVRRFLQSGVRTELFCAQRYRAGPSKD